ncbi:uncharacterized protein [Eleutherodactylus coqui]|uniref:uncharacterized protein n=1 Tax=Eleutherodactylus coqui TaxID=57060 RepID=UPI003462D407
MMAGRGLKRGGCEKMNMESEEESLVKHQKLSEDMKKNPDEADEMSDDDFVDLSEDISNLPEADKENVMEDPSPPEAVEENVMKDPSLQGHHEGFVPVEPTKSEAAEGNVMEDSSPPGHHEGFVPVEPTKSEAAEENVMEDPSPLGDNEDLVLVEATMSDDWIFVIYKKSASELWVVTKSPYSCAWIKDVLESNVFNEYKSDGKTLKFQIDLNEKFKMKLSSCSCVVFYFENDKWDSATAEEVKELSDSYAMKNVIILLSENTSNNPLPGPMRVLNFSKQEVAWYKDNLKFYNSKIEAMKTLVKGKIPLPGRVIRLESFQDLQRVILNG